MKPKRPVHGFPDTAVQVERCILLVRGQKVMLDSDLAALYGVETKVLNQAVRVNIEIMRTFVRLRDMLAQHRDLSRRLKKMQDKYDSQFRVVFEILDKLTAPPPPEPPRPRIGFPIPTAREPA